MLEEQFATLPEYPSYQISSHGRIKNKYGKFLKPYNNGLGYRQVKLVNKDGKSEQPYVHRLVASAYLDNANNLPEVHHIDNDRGNNNVRNICWVTTLQNAQYKLVNRFFSFATQLPAMDLSRWATI